MPSEETEAIIKKVSHVRNEFDEYGDLKESAVTIYNAGEREERETELKTIDGQLNQPAWVNNRLTSERRGIMMNRAKDLRKQLAKYSPPDNLSGETKDALEKYRIELEGKIRSTLLPQEVMWRNPPGAPDEHLKRERSIKDSILIWKNVVTMQNPHNTDQDLRNIERLRPSLANPHSAASFMANARLPGSFAMTPLAKDNFDETFPDSPTIDTAMKQIERRDAELEDLKKRNALLEAKLEVLIGKKTRGKSAWTEEQRQAARDRMAKARGAKGKKKAEVGASA